MTDEAMRHKEIARNSMRAARGEDALRHFLFNRDHIIRKPHCEADVMNLLADLSHYCDQIKIDLLKALDEARSLFEKEKAEES